jgi:hypothetical protein
MMLVVKTVVVMIETTGDRRIEEALAGRLRTMSLAERISVLRWLWAAQPGNGELARWLGLEADLPPKKPVAAESGIRLVRKRGPGWSA